MLRCHSELPLVTRLWDQQEEHVRCPERENVWNADLRGEPASGAFDEGTAFDPREVLIDQQRVPTVKELSGFVSEQVLA